MAPGASSQSAFDWILYGDLDNVSGLKMQRLDQRTALVRATSEQLAQLPDQIWARRPARYFPMLDVATRWLRADRVHGRSGTLQADGRGVLLAVVDTGIDVGHPNFRYSDGSSRFYRYWDQTVNGVRHDPRLGMGTECSSSDINLGRCQLDDEAPLNGVLAYGHGTHVAGIAASGDETYRGFAPGATLIGVRAWFDEASILLALDYLKRLQQSSGRPMVVNLSLGTSDGGHDGNSVLEKWIEANSGSGFVFVAAAGNEATSDPASNGGIHARLESVASGGRAARWMVTGNFLGSLPQAVTQWYASGDLPDRVLVSLLNAAGDPLGNTVVLSRDLLNGGGIRALNADINLVFGRAYFEQSDTSGFALGLSAVSSSDNVAGSTVLIAFEGSDTVVDGWVSDRSGVFAPLDKGTMTLALAGQNVPLTLFPGDNTAIITVPASGRNVIAVGSFVGRLVWPSVDGNNYGDTRLEEGTLSPMSSQGPSRDGRFKPELVASGQYVSSTLSRQLGGDAVPDSLQTDESHMILFGTSMASPMIAGVVALMLERNPSLSVARVRDLLAEHAWQPFPFGNLPDNRFGAGTVDTAALLADTSWQQPELDTRAPVLSGVQVEEGAGQFTIKWHSDEMVNSEIVLRGSGKHTVTVASFDKDHEVVVAKPGFNVDSILIFGTDWAGNRSTAYNVPLAAGCACRITGIRSGLGDAAFMALLLLGSLYWRRNGRQT